MGNRAGRNLRRTLQAVGLAAGFSLACAAPIAGNDAGVATLGGSMPQVVELDTNAVLSAPKVMPISWPTDPNSASLQAFLADFAQSTAWATETSEYGVGPLTPLMAEELSGTPQDAYMDSDIENLLTINLSGTSPPWGAPDPSVIYLVLMPVGSIVTDNSYVSCTDFDGYHSDMQVNNVDIAYAVVAACPSGFDGAGITDLQQITIAASHEIVEASTDPVPDFNPAYAQTDNAHAVWTYTTGGEIADLCEFADTFAWTPSDMTHTIQRVYSDAAARAGTDPCVGDPTKPYYQAIPAQPDPVTINYGGPWLTQGLAIAQGATGTLTLTLMSDTPGSGPYLVSVDDYNAWYSGGAPFLDITTPATPLNVGDTIQATVTVLGQDPNISAEAFVVSTTPMDGSGPTTYYFGLIGE